MNSDLKQLIRLQAIDVSIQEIRTRIDRFPGVSKALDENLKSAMAGLESTKERIKTNQTQRKKFEGDMASLEAHAYAR